MAFERDEFFALAERYVEGTGTSVFLTGKAGTGKTTFLKHITSTTGKRFLTLAPTGVAAINAGGQTIHSFFSLPLCPYLPDVPELLTEYQMPEHKRGLKKDKVKIIRTLDLLIIDEISMVRADILDAVDDVLRRCRRSSRPFGGVQLLMIGDVQQLSPVVTEAERPYLAKVYPTPYFFASKALQQLSYVTVELQKVHRQKDGRFLEILNAIRQNRPTRAVLDALNSRLVRPAAGSAALVGSSAPAGSAASSVGSAGNASAPVGSASARTPLAGPCATEPIRLTTHNRQADEVNEAKLSALPGEPVCFEAEVQGVFPESSYPADPVLSLKVGAQVMFIRNACDSSYYNGKLGIVDSISEEGLVVVRDEAGVLLSVEQEEWSNLQYSLNETSGEIEQTVAGTFRQLPLRTAWAITIHKSQGLTFDNVIINAGSAFAFGQVYVALSRCRTLEGIVLETPVTASVIYSDPDVSYFNSTIPDYDSARARLRREEQDYRFGKMMELFSFEQALFVIRRLRGIWGAELEKMYPRKSAAIRDGAARLEEAAGVAGRFRAQIASIARQLAPPDAPAEPPAAGPVIDENYLNERLHKAAEYFLPIFEELNSKLSGVADVEIDNKETQQSVRRFGEELATLLELAVQTLETVKVKGFSVETYNSVKTRCLLEGGSKPRRIRKVVYADDKTSTVDSALKEKLMEWRSAKFKLENVPAYRIMHLSSLAEIAATVPVTKAELLSVNGFGKVSYDKYGEEILAICREFAGLV